MSEITVNVYNEDITVGVEEIIETVTIVINENAGTPPEVPIETISKNGIAIPIVDKNVDIIVPTKTSELEKDDVYTKTEINNKLSAVYKYKFSVDYYSQLPIIHENGDTYNVRFNDDGTDSGANYAWSDELNDWDSLGGLIGLATLTENGLMSKEDFAALAALKIHNHSGQSINPDNIILNKEYTDIEAEALQVGTIFYNIDQKCWLLKLSSVNYYNFGEELPVLSRIGDDQNHLEGQACYISGGATQLNNVSLASSATGKLNCLATQDVLNTGDKTGYYCYFGQVRKFPYANVIKSTDNAANWVDGADLYLCNEAGKYSTIKEAAPAKASYVGRITNRNGANITVMFIPVEAKATTDLSDWDGSTNAFADAEKILIRKSNGLVQEMTKTDFYAILDDYFAKLSGGNDFFNAQNFDGRINHKIGEKFYSAASKTADTINDTRWWNNAGVEIHQICTVGNSTKEGGNWVDTIRIADNKIYVNGDTGFFYKSANGRLNYSGKLFGDSGIVSGVEVQCQNIQIRTNFEILNKSASAWLNLFSRNTTGSEVAYDAKYIGNIDQYIGKYQFNAASPSSDTINDRRTSNNAGVKIEERCTGNSATKGGGTWVVDSKILADGSKQFGNDINNVTIDANGTIKLNGTATVFDDLKASALSLKQTGAGISLNIPEASVDYLDSADLSDYMVQSLQMPHTWKIGSVIYPHLHFRQTSAQVPNFLIQYRWQINGQAETTAWTNYKANTTAFTYTSGTINQIVQGSGITPPVGATLSDIVEFRIIRDTTNASGLFTGADPLTGTVRVRSFDVHFEQDQLGGSNLEYTK